MKNIFLVTLFLIFGVSLNAQSAKQAKQITQQWSQRYQLDVDQSQKLLVIQERKIKNLKEIRSLKNSNPESYSKKKTYIAKSTLVSFKKILNADQISIYESDIKKYQERQSQEVAKMKEAGIKSSEIKLAIADLEF